MLKYLSNVTAISMLSARKASLHDKLRTPVNVISSVHGAWNLRCGSS